MEYYFNSIVVSPFARECSKILCSAQMTSRKSVRINWIKKVHLISRESWRCRQQLFNLKSHYQNTLCSNSNTNNVQRQQQQQHERPTAAQHEQHPVVAAATQTTSDDSSINPQQQHKQRPTLSSPAATAMAT